MTQTNYQIITDRYAIYNDDCMNVLRQLHNESVDLSIYSPPFSNLYTYSSSPLDFSNVENNEQFLIQFEYLIAEMARVTKKGRINAIHITDLIDRSGTLEDFPSKIIELYRKYGFDYKNRITVWKEPLKVRIRTMVQSLMHKHIVEDSTNCFTANPDYILIFKKRGENKIPVTHEFGFTHYAGAEPINNHMLKAWNNKHNSDLNAEELWQFITKKYKNFEGDPKTNKMSHYIWQRYASSIWNDIRDGHVLEYKYSRDKEDEKHVTPTQLDVIDRLTDLYSNPNEVVLTPFMGVGTEVYSSVSMGRKAIGIELKESYFKQAILNLKDVKNRFSTQQTLF